MTGEPLVPSRRPAAGTVIAIVLLVAGVVCSIVIYQRRQTIAEGAKALEAKTPQTAAELPILGDAVADFSLTERSGKPVTMKTLLGKVWVADFIFTYCGAACPGMSRNMAQLQREFTGKDEPKFVSITSDPKRDTPDVLAEYGRDYQADPDRWWFLTGEKKDLHGLARSLMLAVDVDAPTLHSQSFVLVDREGRVRGVYDGKDGKSLDELRRDLKLLLAAPAKG